MVRTWHNKGEEVEKKKRRQGHDRTRADNERRPLRKETKPLRGGVHFAILIPSPPRDTISVAVSLGPHAAVSPWSRGVVGKCASAEVVFIFLACVRVIVLQGSSLWTAYSKRPIIGRSRP